MEGDNLKWSIDYYETHTAECEEAVKTPDNFRRLPIITSDNFHQFKDGDLVRYQGMVQDMLNPEYYYPAYSIRNRSNGENAVKSGKYRDLAACKENEEINFVGAVPEERLVFFCIPIPATSNWVQNYLKNSDEAENHAGKTNNKRPVEDDDDDDDDDGIGDNIPSQQIKNKKKTGCFNEIQNSHQNDCHSVDKYFPLPEKIGLPCLIKIYEKEDKCEIVLNDRIEVIGFLSSNPALENTWEDSDAEDKALHPPPSLVPRIHALFYNKLIHNNPLLNQTIYSNDIMASAEKIRSDLHLTLTQIFYGDSLAAEYVICYLLSRVYARAGGQALGKLSLNLYNLKSGTYTRRLYEILESLVTNCHYISLSIECLNEKSFIPKKDYNTNRLWSSRLQLADDTHLILDETEMNEGKLEHIGCLNVSALQNLIRDQEIRYDFSYYDVKYFTNISILVLSEGKSMFQTDIHVKLQPEPSMNETTDETFDAAEFFLRGEISNRIRMYLTCMRLQEFEMSEELTRRVGEDYVTMRQQSDRINSNNLHNLLVLSRLLAVSHGRTSLTLEDWSRALEMETERENRF